MVFGSGGANESTVATVSNSGNAQFNGTLQVGGTAQSTGTMTVRNNADAEVDYYLWPGLTTSQKGSFTYKDWNGNSQWYLVKDASNNWALNSATGGLDSFKAYQSTNSGDTYINASNASGVVRVNYETGAGSAFNIYGGNSSNLYASFSGNTSIKFPGLSASSGHNCLQIDASGYITNTGWACGSGSGSGTVNSGSTGQIAYYTGNGTAISGMSTIPVAAGGTGASTAAGALAALGGVSLAATTAQNLAGPLNASVNSQINVMAYGAKGDCSTDDHDAIMAAQTAAISYASWQQLPAALYFPKPPGSCYLTSTIRWAGVSLIGQPGGIGDLTHRYPVVLRGKPGQDILNVPDPTTTTFPWYHSWSIRDITFQNDGTAAGSFPHRWPGKWFDDTATTSGSPIITTSVGELSCGDVGQAIQINGAGASGGNLITTIASVKPCWAKSDSGWQVITLAANAQATLTNAHTYVSVLGLPVTTTVGNCSIAFDMYDGLAADWVSSSQEYGTGMSEMTNVSFVSMNSSTFNHCGIYTQGGWGPYQFNASNVNVYGQTFGVVEGTSELHSTEQSSGNDFQKWNYVWMFGDTYPWISYNGGQNVLSNWQLATLAGPQILIVGTRSYDTAAGWLINIPEFETSTGTPTGYGMRIEGGGHVITDTALSGPGTTGQINANSVRCISCGGGNVIVGGYNNDLALGGGTITDNYTDVGRGNHVVGTYNASGDFGGMPSSYPISLLPYKGESQIVGRVTADNIFDGNYSTPYNHNDLLLWPQDMMPRVGTGAYSDFYSSDSTSMSGANFTFPPAYYVNNFTHVTWDPAHNWKALVIGKQIPAGKLKIIYSAKCPVGITSLDFEMLANGTIVADDVESCTTNFQTYSFTADYSSYSTYQLGFKNNGANNFSVSWVAIRPFANDVNGHTIPGAGATLTTGPATSTLHDCPWFVDTLGTLGDSGGPCGGGLSGQTTGYIPKATSAMGSTTSSAIDDGATTAGAITIHENADILISPNIRVAFGNDIGYGTVNLINSTNSSAGQSAISLVGGSSNATTAMLYELYNGGSVQQYWRNGMVGSTNYVVRDDAGGGKAVINLPSNTMPANSIGGNASGATAITQSVGDNSTNIATDAFVKSNLPLVATTVSIGGTSCQQEPAQAAR